MTAEDTGNRLPQLIDIARLLALELDANRIVERVVLTAKQTTHADGASVYLIENDGRSLALTLMLNDTLGIRCGGDFGEPVEIRPPPLFEADGTPNRRSVVGRAAMVDSSTLPRSRRDSGVIARYRMAACGCRRFSPTGGP